MTALSEVVETAGRAASTTKRIEKKATLAALLALLAAEEVEVVIGFLTGELRQGRIGIGWATIGELSVTPSTYPTLSVLDVDAAVTRLAAMTGTGSQRARRRELEKLFGRATAVEADFLGRLFLGDMRTGALAGVVTDAVAAAAGIRLSTVRRAVMLAGDLGTVARLALVAGEEAVAAVGLEPLRPVQPMLAATAESVTGALGELGTASVEWKLDGARIQVHRAGSTVRIFTRNLNDVTDRLPEVVDLVVGFGAESFVLDGEVLGYLGQDETPHAFQDTMSRFGRDDAASNPTRLAPQFFDLLHLDGVDQIDEPIVVRRRRLAELVSGHMVPGIVTDDPIVAEAVLAEALERGHEGVMVKGAQSSYEAGRRGKSWRKVKPVHTLDLVVLAVEWGSGRRRGTLSNLHLGARDPDTGELVMVGKTFKGLTDDLLAWQTKRFQELRVGETGHVVWVRPVEVVEIALDGAQSSTRYPGGVALRFARVRGYRPDRSAADADTLDAVRALLPGPRRARTSPDRDIERPPGAPRQ